MINRCSLLQQKRKKVNLRIIDFYGKHPMCQWDYVNKNTALHESVFPAILLEN